MHIDNTGAAGFINPKLPNPTAEGPVSGQERGATEELRQQEPATTLPKPVDEVEIDRGERADRDRDAYLDLKYKMKVEQGDDDGFKFELKFKLRARVDDFSNGMRQEIKSRVRMRAEHEERADGMRTELEFQLKAKIDIHVDGDGGAEGITQLMEAFGALFSGFLGGLAEFLGSPAEPLPGVAPVPEPVEPPSDQALIEAELAAELAAPAQAELVAEVEDTDEAVAATDEIDDDDVAETEEPEDGPVVIGQPGDEDSPIASLLARLSEMFHKMTSDLMEALTERREDRAEREEDRFESSFEFQARLNYDQPEPLIAPPVIDVEG